MTTKPVADNSESGQRHARSPEAIPIAVLAAAISGVAAGRPSLWFDEAATISASANRSLSDLWRLLANVDAVHGLYYLFMHWWFAVFPGTEFWSRLPSCLAVGVGAAGVVVLAKQFGNRRLAVCAGVLFAVLPRVTWAGIEARSYALTAMAAVWLTVLCVVAARRNRPPIWLGYGVLIVVATLLNAFTLLVVAAHAAAIRVVPCGRLAQRRWIVTASGAAMLTTPFLLFSQTQIRQVGWISPLSRHTITEVAQQQYFDRSILVAILAGAVIAVAAATVLAGARRLPAGQTPQLLVVCTAWLVVPTVIAVVYSAVSTPVYYPRYLICTAPAMAILLAIAVTTVAAGRCAATALVVVFALAAVPNYVVQRNRYAKEGWDYSSVADLIAARATAGDCLLVDNTTAWAPGPIRALLAARPDAFAGLTDPGRGPRGPALGRLWDGHVAVWAVADQLDRCTVIWTITNHDRTLPARQTGAALPAGPVFARSPDGQLLRRLGFHVADRWQFSFSQVVRSIR